MSRSTQFVGLNKAGRDYVSKGELVGRMKIGVGLFGEDVQGAVYDMPVPERSDKLFTVREVVQVCPWSSGPMFFTHLMGSLEKESGQVIEQGPFCSWSLDPSLKEKNLEFDYEEGRYYV